MATVHTIYYDDNANTFEDDFGSNIDISKIMPIKEIIRYKQIGGIYYSKYNVNDVVYEVEFPIRDLNRSLYYDSQSNKIFDEFGDLIYNIFSIVSPNMLSIFRNKKKTMTVYGINGGLIELIYKV